MKKLIAAALLGAASFAAPAGAAVIDFDGLGGPGSYNCYGPTLVTQGYSFTNSGGSCGLIAWGDDTPQYNADPNGYTLSHNISNTTTIVMEQVGGGTFDLASIDLADIYDNALGSTGGDILFTFTDAGGSSNQTVTIDTTPGLQTFAFNRANLLSFTIAPQNTNGGWIQFDNIVVDEIGSPVPEPATWAMMIAGFGMVGGAIRRRRGMQAALA